MFSQTFFDALPRNVGISLTAPLMTTVNVFPSARLTSSCSFVLHPVIRQTLHSLGFFNDRGWNMRQNPPLEHHPASHAGHVSFDNWMRFGLTSRCGSWSGASSFGGLPGFTFPTPSWNTPPATAAWDL